eukprot:m.58324 g.58324  ORF g.58324 m.58324 type:complete len:308 (+) comp34799_c0_seq20:175-1098(+)
MLQFCSQELKHAAIFKKLLELQAEYHKESLRLLDTVLPNLSAMLGKSRSIPVFGCPLKKHLDLFHRDISVVIEDCVTALMQIAMETEGLFRVAGGAMNSRKLKAMFNAGLVDMSAFVKDEHALAGTLKLYLRELPEPLLTFDLYDQWIQAGSIDNGDERLQTLWTIVKSLPKENLANFRYLMGFFAELAKHSGVNKMTPSNISLVIAPNVIWSREETESAGMTHTSIKSRIVEAFVEHFDWFFSGGSEPSGHVSCHVSCQRQRVASCVSEITFSLSVLPFIIHSLTISRIRFKWQTASSCCSTSTST